MQWHHTGMIGDGCEHLSIAWPGMVAVTHELLLPNWWRSSAYNIAFRNDLHHFYTLSNTLLSDSAGTRAGASSTPTLQYLVFCIRYNLYFWPVVVPLFEVPSRQTVRG